MLNEMQNNQPRPLNSDSFMLFTGFFIEKNVPPFYRQNIQTLLREPIPPPSRVVNSNRNFLLLLHLITLLLFPPLSKCFSIDVTFL